MIMWRVKPKDGSPEIVCGLIGTNLTKHRTTMWLDCNRRYWKFEMGHPHRLFSPSYSTVDTEVYGERWEN